MPVELACPKCASQLDSPDAGRLTPMRCSSCEAAIEVLVFSALRGLAPQPVAPEPRVDESEGGCFFHPQNRAQLPCEVCGRFLCSLCDLEIQGMHLCPACLESGRHRQSLEILVHKRFIPDRAALVLVICPLLFYPMLVVTAPVGLYLAIRSFSSSRSLVPAGRRRRAIIASVLAVLEIIMVAAGFSTLLR